MQKVSQWRCFNIEIAYVSAGSVYGEEAGGRGVVPVDWDGRGDGSGSREEEEVAGEMHGANGA